MKDIFVATTTPTTKRRKLNILTSNVSAIYFQRCLDDVNTVIRPKKKKVSYGHKLYTLWMNFFIMHSGTQFILDQGALTDL